MKPAPFTYQRATTLADAIAGLRAFGDHDRLIAGGQSLGPMLNLRLAQPKQILDISRLDDLRGAEVESDVLAIGACVTHAQIEDGKISDVTRGLMPHVARGIAYRAVRNRGTIGGSLAHADPAADWLTTMIALDASLRLASSEGRRETKVSDFVKGAMDTAIRESELITHVLVPRLSLDAHWGHAKYAKKSGDFAESMAVVVVDPTRQLARVVLGRRAEPPALMRNVSALLALEGCEPAPEPLHTAIEADLKIARADRGDAVMHAAIVRRAVRDLVA
jgi:aerobic carbon-monoxide dehydrogenase medium subunit